MHRRHRSLRGIAITLFLCALPAGFQLPVEVSAVDRGGGMRGQYLQRAQISLRKRTIVQPLEEKVVTIATK